MAQPGDVLVNRDTGQKLTFRRTTAETGGELVEVESELPAGGPKPPAHYHPSQQEHFEVLAGRVDARLGKERRVLEAGDTLDIPPGVVHEMSAAGDEPARLLWHLPGPWAMQRPLLAAVAGVARLTGRAP